jgi:transforming growth factor-beta-induced protein
MKKLVITSLVVSVVFGLSSVFACSTCGCTSPSTCTGDPQVKLTDIVHTAEHAGQFSTLVAALKAADLVDALQTPGPFTVFAPTDKAFAALPKGTVESLLKPENKAKLQAILKYHVVAGKVMSTDLVKYENAKTLHGNSVNLTLMVNNAQVVKADIKATNGVIHVIDQVILPGASQPITGHANTVPEYAKDSIVQTAVNSGQFKTLVTAIQAAGLEDALSGTGPFTVFAPTDAAFAKLPAGTVESLVQPENLATLQGILKYHVVSGKLGSQDILTAHTVKTLSGQAIYPSVLVDNAAIQVKNIYCRNGVIHVIDNVILPKEQI